MNPTKRINAATLAAAVLFAFCCNPISIAYAAEQVMGAPFKLDAKAQAALIAQLAARRNAVGLDADHGYKLQSQHPGTRGTHVMRLAHLYKGLRIFGSESVLVLDAKQQILSESASPRRQQLGRGVARPAAAPGIDPSVKPSVSKKKAIASARKDMLQGAVNVVAPRAELLIYPLMQEERAAGAEKKAAARTQRA